MPTRWSTTYEVVFTDDARHDLFDIYTYVANEDSLTYADKLIEFLKDACERCPSYQIAGTYRMNLRRNKK